MFEKVLAVGAAATAGLRRAVVWLVIAFYGYMIAAVLVQVAGRYVFDYSIGWATETATFAQVWMVMLAAGLAMRDNMHVKVDAVSRALPLPAARFLSLIVTAACLWFLWHAIAGSLSLLAIGRIQSSPTLQIPMWIPYLSLPIGLAYFAFELVLAFARNWRDADTTTPAGSTP